MSIVSIYRHRVHYVQNVFVTLIHGSTRIHGGTFDKWVQKPSQARDASKSQHILDDGRQFRFEFVQFSCIDVGTVVFYEPFASDVQQVPNVVGSADENIQFDHGRKICHEDKNQHYQIGDVDRVVRQFGEYAEHSPTEKNLDDDSDCDAGKTVPMIAEHRRFVRIEYVVQTEPFVVFQIKQQLVVFVRVHSNELRGLDRQYLKKKRKTILYVEERERHFESESAPRIGTPVTGITGVL